jgi:thiamine pyrophosphate-dependent acetolactate synthase large subunit-like protein
MGALSFRIERPGETERALRQAIAAHRPAVIEVIVDPEARPPMGMRLKTLDKFFQPQGGI